MLITADNGVPLLNGSQVNICWGRKHTHLSHDKDLLASHCTCDYHQIGIYIYENI